MEPSSSHLKPTDLIRMRRFIAHANRTTTKAEFISLFLELHRFMPHEYSACGMIDSQSFHFDPSFCNYPLAFAKDYIANGFPSEPALVRLQETSSTYATSEDAPQRDRQIVDAIKRTYGIQNCVSIASQHSSSLIFYMAFSNYRTSKLKTFLEICEFLTPHLKECYLSVAAPWKTVTQPVNPSTVVDLLTPREAEVMKWILDGKANCETAAILGITERTVRFHLSIISEKIKSNPREWGSLTRWNVDQHLSLKGHPSNILTPLKTALPHTAS